MFLVNNSLSGRWLFLALRLTIASLDQVKSFKFLLLLVIFSRILSFTKSLSDQLQSVTNDMARTADLVIATIETLEEIRSDSSSDYLYNYTQDVTKFLLNL